MRYIGFPNCCTATILYDLGGTSVSGMSTWPISKEDITQYITHLLDNCYGGHTIVVATNSEQKVANEALRDMGFSHSKWMSKDAHPNTKLRLWWKQA